MNCGVLLVSGCVYGALWLFGCLWCWWVFWFLRVVVVCVWVGGASAIALELLLWQVLA